MADYYVDGSLVGAGTGTETDPWNTLALAEATATIGDVVYVAGGEYNETIASGGARDVTWHARSGDVVLDGSGLGNVDGIIHSSGQDTVLDADAGSRWIIRNFGTTASDYGISVGGTAGLTINCDVLIYKCGSGLLLSGSGAVSGTGRLVIASTINAHGIVTSGSALLNVTLAEVVIVGAKRRGIDSNNSNASSVFNITTLRVAGCGEEGVKFSSAWAGSATFTTAYIGGNVNPNEAKKQVLTTGITGTVEITNFCVTGKNIDSDELVGGTVTSTVLVENEPIFAESVGRGSVSLMVDDTVNTGSADTMIAKGNQYGFPVCHCLDFTEPSNGLPINITDWARFSSMVSQGHEVSLHTRQEANLSDITAMRLKHDGAGSTVTIALNKLNTTISGGTGANIVDLDLTAYDTVADLVTYLDGLTGYSAETYDNLTARVGTNLGMTALQFAGRPKAKLLEATIAQDITGANGLEISYNQEQHFDENIGNNILDISSNISYVPTTAVYPGGWLADAFAIELEDRGVAGARGAPNSTKTSWYLSSCYPYASEAWHMVDIWPPELTDAAYTESRRREAVIAFCEWVKTSGACVQLYIHGVGGVNYTTREIEVTLDAVAESGVRVKTYKDQIADMKSGTSDAGTSPNYTQDLWPEQISWQGALLSDNNGSAIVPNSIGTSGGTGEQSIISHNIIKH